jgi:hypothetical protein
MLWVVICRNRDSAQLAPERREQSPALEQQIAAALVGRPGLKVIELPHLYDLNPAGPAVAALRCFSGDLVVLSWLYPRSAFWVLDAFGIRGVEAASRRVQEPLAEAAARARKESEATAERAIWCFDLRAKDQAELLQEILRIAGTPGPEAADAATSGEVEIRRIEETVRARWYPVIDFGRCSNCLECLNFCLFGVFSLSETDALRLDQPDACRPGCPACARVCPQGAILFPQHADPAIAGDTRASSPGGLRLDLSQLFSGVDPAELAAAERAGALAGGQAPTAAEDDLDRLVEKLDELEG